MEIFGQQVLSEDELWDLYTRIAASEAIWRPDEFAAAARACGLRRIARRKAHFSFEGRGDLRGQAPIVEGAIEELRLFIGNAPSDLDLAQWQRDSPLLRELARSYSALFRQRLGPPRRAHDNDIFEYQGHRVRVLADNQVWVVISNLDVVRRLPNDWWAPS